MKCKNCFDILEKEALFCDNCGAKVVKSRITFKVLVLDLFINVFGLDSKFFFTLKKMFIQPNEVLNEYIIGVRKRYVNPFAFLAIGTALSLFVFNFFDKEFIEMNSVFNSNKNAEIVLLQEQLENEMLTEKERIALEKKYKIETMSSSFLNKYLGFNLKYFNLITFLLLPVYSLISKLTFYKPHNYGEHIVMNAYIQGTTMYLSIILFFVSMVSYPELYASSIFIYIFYYLYVFKKLYQLKLVKLILRFLKFLVITILLFLLITITAGILIGTSM